MAADREEKLPKWARDELRILRKLLGEAHEAYRHLREAPKEDSPIIVEPSYEERRHFQVDPGATVSFYVGGRGHPFQRRLQASLRGDAGMGPCVLDIHSTGPTLSVYPRAANAVWLALEDD